VKHQKKKIQAETVNLVDSTFGAPQPKQKEEEDPEEEVDDTFYPHWKPVIDLNVIYDQTHYDVGAPMSSEVARNIRIDQRQMKYQPILYLSDFWLLKRDYVLLNDTLEGTSLNLTLNFQNYPVYYFQFQQSFETQLEKQKEWGLETLDLDEMKRIWIETDRILLSVTMVVSLLHTVFEMLAFKNDIQFWNSKDSMEGISVKTLYF